MSRTPRSAGHRLLLLAAILVASPALGGSGEGDSRNEEAWADWSVCLHGKLEHAALTAAAAVDESTGRDLRNFPPDRLVDFLHMRLEMRFEDLNDRRFEAVETLRVRPIGTHTTALQLDAVGLDVSSATVGGRPVEFFADDAHVILRFDPPLPVDQEHDIVLQYVCDRPYTGLFFTPYRPEAPDYTAEVHTQGQTEDNRHWFIAHDSPNERMTTELIVDVPAEYSVSSNGRLVGKRSENGRAVWHWLQDKPHVSYLVTLVIGQFDIVELPHPRVPMHVWVPVGLGDRVQQTYGRTGEMIDLFERRFGVPYPWDRYDQLVVKNFNAGGMENTSATTMYPSAIFDSAALLDRDMDGLIAHELAHQWTGDLLTCKSWAHIWLNEGWATYGAALWFEARDGRDGYLDSIRGSFRVAGRDRTTDEVGMVSPVYENADEVFRRRANPYPKGASILHMLRMMLGEDVFWSGVHLYMNRHHMDVVETSDFRYAMEEVSGLGLEWFFEQWCYRPGSPELDVQVRYDGHAGDLLIDVEQKQKIDADTPAFRFTLPVHVITASGTEVHEIKVREQNTSFRAALGNVPRVVAIDPELHVLKTITVEKPRSMWLAQLETGPTIAARHEAIRALGETDNPEHVDLLAAIVRSTSERHTLRTSAVRALAGYGSDEARAMTRALAQDGIEDARVRAALVRAAAEQEDPALEDFLSNIAATDPSYATRVAAINGLAGQDADAASDLFVELTAFPSQHEQVRDAALRALARLDDERGLELGMRYAAYGNLDRSRPTAIGVIADLAHHDRDAAVEYLLPLLEDPEQRTIRATARALGKIGDKRALDPLQAMARTHPNPRIRERAKGIVEQLEKE
ncbi:MAG: M1 family aminopeptidase [Planctomycetota bacterium]|jgi:aminopeptidase N